MIDNRSLVLVSMVRFGTWAATVLSLVSIGATSAVPVAPAPVSPQPAAISPNPSCTQTPITVPNGDFESGSLSPWTSATQAVGAGPTPAVAIVPGGYQNSKYAVQLSAGYTAQIDQQRIPSCQATAYIISYAYKVLNATSAKSCSLYARAYRSKFHSFDKNIPLQVGDWTTAAFEYKSNLAIGYKLEFEVACTLKDTSATVLLDDIQVTSAGSIAAQGCPKAVGLTNGGFDDGQFAPWVPSTDTFSNPPQIEVVAPGNDSPYAFQMDFGAAAFTDWYFGLNFTGLCDGSVYDLSYAVNWLNYTGPPSGPSGGCDVGVLAFGCQPLDANDYTVYATSTPGWTQYSYKCQSSTNAAVNLLNVEVSCESATVVPAFSLQMDSFAIQLDTSASAADAAPATRSAHRDGPVVPRWI